MTVSHLSEYLCRLERLIGAGELKEASPSISLRIGQSQNHKQQRQKYGKTDVKQNISTEEEHFSRWKK